jgi:hypothetical protein
MKTHGFQGFSRFRPMQVMPHKLGNEMEPIRPQGARA